MRSMVEGFFPDALFDLNERERRFKSPSTALRAVPLPEQARRGIAARPLQIKP